MNQGLFESLTGTFADGTPVDNAGSPRQKRIHSIMDNLNRLFNTRQGMLPHLPTYGLPDISEVYRKMPHGIEELKNAIQKTVSTYEPRLKRVKVELGDTDKKRFKIIFILSGEMENGGKVHFQTTFTSTGNSSISPWKKPE